MRTFEILLDVFVGGLKRTALPVKSRKHFRAWNNTYIITLALRAFQVSQQYLRLLPSGGSYTENVSKNAHAGQKDITQEKMTNYKLITKLL